MGKIKHNLLVDQLDRKLKPFQAINETVIPLGGWIHTIRVALNMSLQQFGRQLGITRQSAREIELREKNGSITLKSLQQAAESLNMKLVYGFIPKDGTIEKLIEKKARQKAQEIVMQTAHTLKLENQEISEERLQKNIAIKTDEIKKEIPRYLWD